MKTLYRSPLNYAGVTPAQQAWIDRAYTAPVEYLPGRPDLPILVGRFDSTADLWRDLPFSVRVHDREDPAPDTNFYDWQYDRAKARAYLAAGRATAEQLERVQKCLRQIRTGEIVSDFAAYSRRPTYAHFADADETIADRVTEGAEIWQAGIRRGRIAPTVRIGFDTLASFGHQHENSYTLFAAIAHAISEAAAALGWNLEMTYGNVGIETFAGARGLLGIAVRFFDGSRPFDPETLASHANSAGHKVAAWAWNCATCPTYISDGLRWTSSRNNVTAERDAITRFLGLDYYVCGVHQNLSLHDITAGILRGGMDAALAAARE